MDMSRSKHKDEKKPRLYAAPYLDGVPAPAVGAHQSNTTMWTLHFLQLDLIFLLGSHQAAVYRQQREGRARTKVVIDEVVLKADNARARARTHANCMGTYDEGRDAANNKHCPNGRNNCSCVSSTTGTAQKLNFAM